MLRHLGTITIPAGESNNSMIGVRASLDLATAPGNVNIDTVVEAVLGGAAGNDIALAMSHGAGSSLTFSITDGVTIVPIALIGGTSTVADLEAAIGTLTGAQALIRVKTPGTGANVIATTDDFASIDLAGGVDGFAIPLLAHALEVVSEDDDLTVGLAVDPTGWDPLDPAAYAPPFAEQSEIAADAGDYPLSAGFAKRLTIGNYGSPSVLACYNAGMTEATLEVYVGD